MLVLLSVPINVAAEILVYELKVHFIDVGQGDSALVQLPSGQSVLIDAGDGGAAGKVVRYLHDQDITKIDHLIATHPHENHIGGMIYVKAVSGGKSVYAKGRPHFPGLPDISDYHPGARAEDN